MTKGTKTGGRKAGVPNKITADLRAAILCAFNRKGGADYLTKIADEHPQVFCSLLGKIIPQEVKASVTHVNDPNSLPDAALAAIAFGGSANASEAETGSPVLN